MPSPALKTLLPDMTLLVWATTFAPRAATILNALDAGFRLLGLLVVAALVCEIFPCLTCGDYSAARRRYGQRRRQWAADGVAVGVSLRGFRPRRGAGAGRSC